MKRLLAFLICWATPVTAHDWRDKVWTDMVHSREYAPPRDWDAVRRRQAYWARVREQRQYREVEYERSYELRGGRRPSDNCLPLVRDHGGEHLTLSAAWRDAVDSWVADVRAEYGERYIDLDNAEDVHRDCFRSSTVEGFVNKAIEGAARMVKSDEGYRKRCFIIARPCASRPERLDR